MSLEQLIAKVESEGWSEDRVVVDRAILERLLAAARALSCDGCGGTGLASFQHAAKCERCTQHRDQARQLVSNP